MKLNPRTLLRLSSNLTLWLIISCGIGMILWLIDTVLDWDILPDFIDIYVELILSVFAVITGLSILLSLICTLAIGGEYLASKTQIPDQRVNSGVNRKIYVVLGTLFILLFIFYGVSSYRQNSQREANLVKNQKAFDQKSSELDSALSVNFKKIEASLISYIDNQEKNESDLSEMIISLENSLPHSPKLKILISGIEPYKFQILDVSTYRDEPILNTEKLLSLPTSYENQILDDIINVGETSLPFKNEGAFFSTKHPYAWVKTSSPEQPFIILMLKAR